MAVIYVGVEALSQLGRVTIAPSKLTAGLWIILTANLLKFGGFQTML